MLHAAEVEARARRQAVGSPHLLLGLIADRDGAPAKALEAMGFSVEDVRYSTRRSIGSPSGRPSRRRPPYSTRAEVILGHALDEAQANDRKAIEPVDLLLALVREQEGKAAAVLNTLRKPADDGKVPATF